MSQTTTAPQVRGFHLLPKDIGVALVLVIALALGLLLRDSVESRTALFRDPATRFSIQFPTTWGRSESLKGVFFKVEDPRTASPFKTTLSVEARGLDPQSPPTLQSLVDRQVARNGTLTAYHLISTRDDKVDGQKATRLEYAHVVQPIDQPRRASLPVVVHAIEYVVIAKENAFFITLAAPESEFAQAEAQMNKIIQTVKVQ